MNTYDAGNQRVQKAREYYDLCKKSYSPRPTEYQSGVLLGLEIAINFAGPPLANTNAEESGDEIWNNHTDDFEITPEDRYFSSANTQGLAHADANQNNDTNHNDT